MPGNLDLGRVPTSPDKNSHCASAVWANNAVYAEYLLSSGRRDRPVLGRGWLCDRPQSQLSTESPLCFPTEPISACCSHSSLGELITTRLYREDSRKLAPGFPTRAPYPFAGSVPVFFSLQYIIAVSTTICSVLLANYQTWGWSWDPRHSKVLSDHTSKIAPANNMAINVCFRRTRALEVSYSPLASTKISPNTLTWDYIMTMLKQRYPPGTLAGKESGDPAPAPPSSSSSSNSKFSSSPGAKILLHAKGQKYNELQNQVF